MEIPIQVIDSSLSSLLVNLWTEKESEDNDL